MRKPAFLHMRKQKRRSAAAALFSLHRLYNPSTSKNQNYKPLPIFCGCTALFVSDLFRNPQGRFSHEVALLVSIDISLDFLSDIWSPAPILCKSCLSILSVCVGGGGVVTYSNLGYPLQPPLGKIGNIYMSLVVRKPVFGVSDLVQHKPGCTATEDG